MQRRLCQLHDLLLSQLCLVVLLLCTYHSRCDATNLSALSVPAESKWYGYDGNWSPVTIRVGSPPQWVSVLVSTRSQETLIIGAGGCNANDTICREKRGDVFNSSLSSTWNNVGYYELGLNTHLGFSGYAQYGYDNIAVNSEAAVSDQIVGIVNSTDHLLGFIGLGVKETNFTDANKPSFLTTMVRNQTWIPSRSYGYTAGARYRFKGFPASLTLGGFDFTRFVPHDTSFTLDPDKNPVVAINEITVSASPLSTSSSNPSWSSNPLTLLTQADAELFTIDSSTPFLWLPQDICDQFASALGLTYDEALQLYTFGNSSTQHDILVGWNLTFTFRISDLVGSANNVDITLPYDAFDLQLTYPFPGLNATAASPGYDYFPLRRAANSAQYTLGRSFLQESYLVVDYDRSSFSVSQARFSPDALSNDIDLTPILPPDNVTRLSDGQNSPKPGDIGSVSKELFAGVISGIVIGLIAIIITLTLCYRRHYRGEKADGTHPWKANIFQWRWFARTPKDSCESQTSRINELVGEHEPAEVEAEQKLVELPVDVLVELPDCQVPRPGCGPQRTLTSRSSGIFSGSADE